ncbi:PHD finger protein 7 [Columba livia]|nr:PHD finger protein 7 [Columba livia]
MGYSSKSELISQPHVPGALKHFSLNFPLVSSSSSQTEMAWHRMDFFYSRIIIQHCLKEVHMSKNKLLIHVTGSKSRKHKAIIKGEVLLYSSDLEYQAELLCDSPGHLPCGHPAFPAQPPHSTGQRSSQCDTVEPTGKWLQIADVNRAENPTSGYGLFFGLCHFFAAHPGSRWAVSQTTQLWNLAGSSPSNTSPEAFCEIAELMLKASKCSYPQLPLLFKRGTNNMDRAKEVGALHVQHYQSPAAAWTRAAIEPAYTKDLYMLEIVCSNTVLKSGVTVVHVSTLFREKFFANKLSQQGVEEVGLRGFLPEDIRHTINRAAQQHCFICGDSGATITCWETGCDRSFHLPCATQGECVTQFLFQYRSFCWEHSTKQTVEAAPEDDTTCLICLDLVGDRRSYSVVVCPACKHAWFHRGCIQGQAVRDGISRFQCPLCRDRDAFLSEMLTMGIRIPFRLPSWDSLEYGALSERHSRCDATECLCPGGRGQGDEEGPWQLLLCCSCASEGIHRGCSYLWNSTSSWECDICAGLGTGPSAGRRGSSRGRHHLPHLPHLPGPCGGQKVLQQLSERHSRCDAGDCICPGGRGQAEGTEYQQIQKDTAINCEGLNTTLVEATLLFRLFSLTRKPFSSTPESITMDCLTKFSGTGTEDNKAELLRSLESTAGEYRFPHEGKSSPNPFRIRVKDITYQGAATKKKIILSKCNLDLQIIADSKVLKFQVLKIRGSTDDQKETNNRENTPSKMELEKFHSKVLTSYTLNLSFNSKPLQLYFSVLYLEDVN